MSFSSKQSVCCLDDQFQYYLLTGDIKTPMVLKCQQFEDSESDAMEPRASKPPSVDAHDNKKGEDLKKYQSKTGRYVPLLFCLQKESNRPTDLGKVIRSLNHLVYIPKLPHQIIANFV